ncbi:hypothetical protein QQ045_010133 [Rhodiola kirilowii]
MRPLRLCKSLCSLCLPVSQDSLAMYLCSRSLSYTIRFLYYTSSLPHHIAAESKKVFSGSLLKKAPFPKRTVNTESLLYISMIFHFDEPMYVDVQRDMSEGSIVPRRGRLQITSGMPAERVQALPILTLDNLLENKDKFGVHTIRGNKMEMMAALYFQVSIVWPHIFFYKVPQLVQLVLHRAPWNVLNGCLPCCSAGVLRHVVISERISRRTLDSSSSFVVVAAWCCSTLALRAVRTPRSGLVSSPNQRALLGVSKSASVAWRVVVILAR